MKVIINGEVYDSKFTPVVLAFDNDAQRERHIKNLGGMQPKEGLRLYAVYPTTVKDRDSVIKNAMKVLQSDIII
jgi:hypothetical protein